MTSPSPQPPKASVLKLAALHYYALGLNITCIKGCNPRQDPKSFKRPVHPWRHYTTLRQWTEEIEAYPWEKASGLGTVLGYEEIRALDFDDCLSVREELIQDTLQTLGLPHDYEWVTLSRSGFHVIIKCHESLSPCDDYSVFLPSPHFEDKFKRYEIRWRNHLVLPPSLHAQSSIVSLADYWNSRPSAIYPAGLFSNNHHYVHRSGKFPTRRPIEVKSHRLEDLTSKFSGIPGESKVIFVLTGSGSEDADMSYPLRVLEPSKSNTGISGERLSLTITSGETYQYLFFDTETTGIPLRWDSPISDLGNWPRLVQLAFVCSSETGQEKHSFCSIIAPRGYKIPEDASKVHGITTERALLEGIPIESALSMFAAIAQRSRVIVAHNLDFDEKVLSAEYLRNHMQPPFRDKTRICTMKSLTGFVGIPGRHGGFKWPTLQELHIKIFGESFKGAHDALNDVRATSKCFMAAKENGFWVTE